jgi:hypothetical protein
VKTILATLLLVITFLTACAAKPAQAITALPTVGIYDENTIQPNAVDF